MKRKLSIVLLAALASASIFGCAKAPSDTANVTDNVESILTEVAETIETQTADATESEAAEETQTSVPDVRDYLNGDIKAVVDEGVSLGYDDFEMQNCGKEYTFDELTEALCASEYSDPHTPKIYTFVLTRDGKDVLLIKYDGMDIYCPDDDSFVVMAVCSKDDGYHITSDIQSWCRNQGYMYADGAIEADGSGGAGDHIFDGGYLDSDGKYNEVYYAEECYSGWIGGMFEYYKQGYFSNDTLNLAHQMDGEESVITLYTIGGKMYGYIEEAKTQVEKDLIESSKKDGLEWLTLDEISAKIDETWKAGIPGYDKDSHQEISWEYLETA